MAGRAGMQEVDGQDQSGAHGLLWESPIPPGGSGLLRLSETVPAFNT